MGGLETPQSILTCTHAFNAQAAVGDKYQIYLLEDRESRPTAVVLPRGEGMDETIDKGTEVRGWPWKPLNKSQAGFIIKHKFLFRLRYENISPPYYSWANSHDHAGL